MPETPMMLTTRASPRSHPSTVCSSRLRPKNGRGAGARPFFDKAYEGGSGPADHRIKLRVRPWTT